MKTIKITEETRAYSEEEAQDYINKAKEEAKAAATPKDIELLTEIRDLLKEKAN